MIAVLIPTYKPGNYIESCLASIEKQLLAKADFTVYIALNGSDSSSYVYLKKILKKFTFKYKLHYFSKAGVSFARNFLIDNSNEDFIIFIDDDDIISPNYLSELAKVTTSEIMGISNISNFFKSPSEQRSNYIGASFKKLKKIETSKIKSRKYYSSPCAKMLHRNMLANCRFDTSLARGEDSLFMAKISKNIKAVQKTPSNTYYFVYEREGSTTRRKVSKKEEMKRIRYLLGEYFKLFIKKDYDRLFIFTRILATLKHIKNLF
ncbi:glycosyltransferase family 2 protein [Ignatzschineria cameli]|uniref:glycosyltransferase family 2 protein n=1 Tax=Ignatzschineria cameli TaxID=2182793 RepID=UPI000D603B1A|nr:glycosyltransferase family 2 protein [Ignatzschineria cameli]PWD85360.1 hypothetical protein DC080_06800 [Ignatzschineria cameli]